MGTLDGVSQESEEGAARRNETEALIASADPDMKAAGDLSRRFSFERRRFSRDGR